MQNGEAAIEIGADFGSLRDGPFIAWNYLQYSLAHQLFVREHLWLCPSRPVHQYPVATNNKKSYEAKILNSTPSNIRTRKRSKLTPQSSEKDTVC